MQSVRDQILEPLGSELYLQVWNQKYRPVWNQVEGQVRGPVQDQVFREIRYLTRAIRHEIG